MALFHSAGVVIIEGLLERNVKQIYVTDCHQKRIDDLKDKFGEVADGKLVMEKVPLDDLSILSYPCDILSPCALGNVSTAKYRYNAVYFILVTHSRCPMARPLGRGMGRLLWVHICMTNICSMQWIYSMSLSSCI